jgi:hypothetical protein
VAPEGDNKNMASGGESNADGEGFPLLWINGAIVERKKPAKPAAAAPAPVVPASPVNPVAGKGS